MDYMINRINMINGEIDYTIKKIIDSNLLEVDEKQKTIECLKKIRDTNTIVGFIGCLCFEEIKEYINEINSELEHRRICEIRTRYYS